MYTISQFTVKTQTSLHICAVSPEPLQYVVCIQYTCNMFCFYHITRHEANIGLRKNRVQLNNKKNPVFVQVIVLFDGINDIIYGWTINTVIFPKACNQTGVFYQKFPLQLSASYVHLSLFISISFSPF